MSAKNWSPIQKSKINYLTKIIFAPPNFKKEQRQIPEALNDLDN
jgi:hypothetical protein